MKGSLQNEPCYQELSDGSKDRQYLFFTVEGHVFEHIIKLHPVKDGAELWYCEWELKNRTRYLPLICRIDTKNVARDSKRRFILDVQQRVRDLLKKWRERGGPVIMWGVKAFEESTPEETGNPESIY